MLVYQLMPAHYALEDLEKRRLKVSLLHDLNDPFELLAAELRTVTVRTDIAAWQTHMAEVARLLCFSRRFTNPVLWSHYADKHKGIALGFDVPDHHLIPVVYASKRLAIDLEKEVRRPGGISEQYSLDLLRTKFSDWQYEDEVRMFLKPSEVNKEGGLQFFPFGPDLKLRRVLLGPKCTETTENVRARLHPDDCDARIYRTRLAFRSYRVIRTPASSREAK